MATNNVCWEGAVFSAHSGPSLFLIILAKLDLDLEENVLGFCRYISWVEASATMCVKGRI
jgi:hypothetical protein